MTKIKGITPEQQAYFDKQIEGYLKDIGPVTWPKVPSMVECYQEYKKEVSDTVQKYFTKNGRPLNEKELENITEIMVQIVNSEEYQGGQ